MNYEIRERNGSKLIAAGVLGESAMLFEGNWYFAPEAVDMKQLHVTERTYVCPYKGVCYWIDLNTAQTRAQNIAWVYNEPKPGYEAIRGWIGFWSHDTQGTLVSEQG